MNNFDPLMQSPPSTTMEDYPISSFSLDDSGFIIAADQVGRDWLGLNESFNPVLFAEYLTATDLQRWEELWRARTSTSNLNFQFTLQLPQSGPRLFQVKGYPLQLAQQRIWNFTFKLLPFQSIESDEGSNDFYALPYTDIFRNFYFNLAQIQSLFILSFDANFNVLGYNTDAKKVYGMRGPILGKSLFDIFPNFTQATRYDDILNALKGQLIPFRKYKSKLVNRYIEDFILPIKNHNDKIVGITIIGRDITDDVYEHQAMQSKNSQLESINRDLISTNNDLSQFASIASHDLQEPLRKITMFSSRILERDSTKLSDESRVYFERINNSIIRMNRLIQSLLNFSRVGSQAVDKAPVKLMEIIGEVKVDLEAAIIEKRATIIYQKLPIIQGDRMQMLQLFLNLINNSIKYSKTNVSPIITINCEEISTNNKLYYKIVVQDNGIGFSNEYNDKLFDMFVRLHGKNEYEGTGIGLALCKRIVENHGGFIRAEGILDQGAKFEVYLPK